MRSAYIAVDIRGETLLRDLFTNKSTACTTAERAKLGLDGLLPPAVSTMDQQLARVHEVKRTKVGVSAEDCLDGGEQFTIAVPTETQELKTNACMGF